jgi:hypothetical protein
LTWNDLPGCRVCDLRDFCQRCFADAERMAGDALAPYARACQSALWKYEADLGVEPELDGSPGAAPLGPFRRTGEHRFVAEPIDAAGGTSPVPSQPLVPLRRHAAGPTLMPLPSLRRSGQAALEPETERRAGTTVA